MTAITIRDVPEPVVRNLKQKASDAGKSLQAYLLDLLTFDGSKPSMAQLMDRLEREAVTRVSVSDVLDAIDAARERR